MPDVEWIMKNCYMMRDKRKDGTYYLHGTSKHYGRT